MKKILVVLLAIALSCTPVFGAAQDPNFVTAYETKKGLVTFNHQAHAESIGECANCHGQLEAFGGEVNKKFGHVVCKQCHKDILQLSPNAPVKCNGCHVK
jgi:hypothetical protein